LSDVTANTGYESTGLREKTNKLKSVFLAGIFSDNPSFRLILGTCPLLAVTTSVINGVGMGISATAVLICSNIVISLIRNFIPDTVRIPAYITVIAGFVTITDLILHAFTPDLYSALGIFIPLIVVNCIILARAEMFANKNGVLLSAVDGLGMGIGFTSALILIGSLRELLGNGTIFGIVITQRLFTPAALMLLPPGGFMAYGTVLAVVNRISRKKTPVMSCDGCALKCGVIGGGALRINNGAAGGGAVLPGESFSNPGVSGANASSEGVPLTNDNGAAEGGK
jgi:electron transport complex protein RnfE